MAKLTDKLFNRVIEGEMLPVVSFTEEEFTAGKVDVQLKNLHVGDLIILNDSPVIITYSYGNWISGIQFLDDNILYTFYFNLSNHGFSVNEIHNIEGIMSVINEIPTLTLTHSFAELDKTLQGIITTAIADGSTSCTEAQWAVIKALLDKSLYLNYDNVNYIKTAFNGIDFYCFGGVAYSSGSKLESVTTLQINYDKDIQEIYINIGDL